MVTIVVDHQEIQVEKGLNLLQACLENGIYIPNLCFLQEMDEPAASCRLCFVEIGGEEKPVPACTVRVQDGMVIRTDTPSVRRLQRSGFRLLMSVHDVDCGHCPANKRCELQRIAKFLKVGLKPKGLDITLKEPKVIQEHPLLDYYPNRCVLCGRCIVVCRSRHGRAQMTFSKRGFDTLMAFYGENEGSICEDCLACVDVCPVAAITLRNHGHAVETAC